MIISFKNITIEVSDSEHRNHTDNELVVVLHGYNLGDIWLTTWDKARMLGPAFSIRSIISISEYVNYNNNNDDLAIKGWDLL